MLITKYGHCCLLIEHNSIRILTDPGVYSEQQNNILNIDIVLITHEHSDHLHIESLKKVLVNNPQATIITNSAVGEILKKDNIEFRIIEDGQSDKVCEILFEGFGTSHAIMYPSFTPVQNTGYFIADKLFYPGDALTNPHRTVNILLLPVAGPWIKMSEAIDYAIALKPNICIPVHDGGLKTLGTTNTLPPRVLTPLGIKYQILENNVENLVE
jgi:L-ascorbate metabolism protein UlaG (beta-lactamase superfamily)